MQNRDDTRPADPAGTRAAVLDRLSRARARQTAVRVAAGVSGWLTVLLAAGVVLVGVESIAYLPPAAKIAAFAGLAALSLACVVFGILRPILRPDGLTAIAARVEAVHGGLNQHLTNVLQLWPQRESGSRASRDLIDAAVAQAARATRDIDFADTVDTAPAARAGRRLGLTVVVGLLALQLFPGGSVDAISRLSRPGERYVRPRETTIAVSPGDTTLIVGDSLAVAADVFGLVPLEAALFRLEAGTDEWSRAVVPVRNGRAVFPVGNVRRSFAYRWSVHDAESETHHVTARPRPVVLALTARYAYPAYTGLPDRVDTDGGDIAALSGTRVTLGIRSSRPLADAWLGFDGGARAPAVVSGDTATAVLDVIGPGRFTIGLRDTAGIPNADPVAYRVMPLEDEPPRVSLLRPGADFELGERMQVPLLIEATDDFGVARLEVVYRLAPDGEETLAPIEIETGAREVARAHVWDLAGVNLLPGDQILYRVRAVDINTVTGPGIGETPEYVVRFPSLAEIHENARRAQDDAVEQLEEMAERSRQLQEKIEDVGREIIKKDEANWEDRAEIQEVVKEQERLREQLEENARVLDRARQRMEQSGMLSAETLEKIEQVRALMESLDAPELERLSRELREASSEADPEMIREAIERLTTQQEAFRENLDRTISLLKRVRDEQMLDALTARVQELAREQDRIRRSIASDRPPEDLPERQETVGREAERVEEAIEEAARTVDAPDDRLPEFAESFESARVPDRADQTGRDARAGRRDRAESGARQLSEDLERLASEMAAIRDAHREARRDALLDQLVAAFRNAVDLSRAQEETALQSARDRTDLEALAREQTADLNAASRLADRIRQAGRETFLLPPEAGNGLQNAIDRMQGALGNLQRGLGDRAGKDAREAMAGLNSAAVALREAIGAVRSAGSSTGLEEMLQQLAKASDRQGDLNAQTEGALGQPQPGGSSGQGGLSRLSAEQQAIRQMLEEIRSRFGEQEGDALGDLGAVSEDMADVADRLGRGLDRPLLERQRRILSRLLDAQRSLRRRGFSNDREARTGGEVAYRGPGSLPDDLGETDNPLRARMRDALRQAYPDEYQTIIRRYFDRLIEDARRGSTP